MPSRVEKRGEGFLRTPPYRLLVLAGVLVLAAGGFVWAQEEAVQEEFLQEEPVSVEVSPQESGLPEQERESPDLLDPSAEAPGPPITLTIQEAIQAALTGNRQYLDRVDAIRQQFGIGEVLVEESLTVLPAGAGTVPGASTVSVSSQTTGLAAAKTQFETRITPSVSIRKNKAEGQELVESESLGVSIGKQFVTGGRLSVTSSLASVDFEERSSNLNLDFSQPLLRGAWPFVVNEGVVSARSNLRKQELALECCESTSRQGLIFEVISAYWNIQN
ncbi:MAG TPA: hypothetical protein VLB09_05350, partial [Nitrospiria bacterium]|nr:hypothetical protein [Nitrospiria bacterium]